LKNIVLSFQLPFQQRYLHFSPGENVRGEMSGGKWPGPIGDTGIRALRRRHCAGQFWSVAARRRSKKSVTAGAALAAKEIFSKVPEKMSFILKIF